MNENSNKVRTSIKEALFDENRDLLDIIYYLGQGFMLAEQIYTYGSFLYGLSKDRIRRKIINLHGKGLLLEKQATTTNTKIYVLNKYVLSKYKSKSSQDVSSVKITDNKFWKNLYVNEFIIRNILPCINKNHLNLSISTIFGLLEDNFMTFMYSQNRHDVFKIYGAFYDRFEIKNTEDFNKDYYALTSDLYNYGRNF